MIFSMRDSVVLEVEPERSLVILHIFRTDVSMINSMNGRLYAGSDLLAMYRAHVQQTLASGPRVLRQSIIYLRSQL